MKVHRSSVILRVVPSFQDVELANISISTETERPNILERALRGIVPYDTMRETGFKVAWEDNMKYSVYNLPNASYLYSHVALHFVSCVVPFLLNFSLYHIRPFLPWFL